MCESLGNHGIGRHEQYLAECKHVLHGAAPAQLPLVRVTQEEMHAAIQDRAQIARRSDARKDKIFRFPSKNMKTVPRKRNKSANPAGFAKTVAKHKQVLHAADSEKKIAQIAPEYYTFIIPKAFPASAPCLSIKFNTRKSFHRSGRFAMNSFAHE